MKSGGFGSVFLGRDVETGKSLAVKVMNVENETDRKAMEREVFCGLTLRPNNPFLIQYKKVITKNDLCIIVMDYFVDGDLALLIEQRKQQNQPLSVEESLSFLFQCCTGLKGLHDRNIIHRDLKPGNILNISGKIFVISDYSISRKIDPSDPMTAVSSNGYVSPELLCGTDNLTSKIDIFSVGVLFLELLCLKHPFSNSNGSINLGNVMAGKINPISAEIPVPVKTLALRMLNIDPAQRPTVDEILADPVVCGHVVANYARLLVLTSGSEQRVEEERTQSLLILSGKETIKIVNHPLFPNTIEVHGRVVRAVRLAVQRWNSAFAVLNKKLETGIYQLTCKGEATVGVFSCPGRLEEHHLGDGNYLIANYQNGCVWQNGLWWGNNPSSSLSVVGVEVDMEQHTLRIFLDGVLQPVSFRSLPSPLLFYLGFTRVEAEAEIISFTALSDPSVSASSPTAPIYDPERKGYEAGEKQWKEGKK